MTVANVTVMNVTTEHNDLSSANHSTLFNLTDDGSQGNYIQRILPSVVAMLILFILSAVGNVTVFFTLVTSRSRKTRISIIILHLTIADLFVTFILIPTEIVWRLLRFWLAGNVACKAFAFLRAFGFYLSSMVLIVVSLDRYIAIIYPLRANSEFARRGHFMLVAAWAISTLCSLPQAFMWHTSPAPSSPDHEQCVTFGSDQRAVTAFTLFFLGTVYFIPLLIMVVTYSRILSTIVRQSDFRQSAHNRGSIPQDQPTTTEVINNNTNVSNLTALAITSSPPVRQYRQRHQNRSCSIPVLNRSPRPNPSFLNGSIRRFSSRMSRSDLEGRGRLSSAASRQTMAQRAASVDYRSSHFNRARARTLRMTVIIVLAFILCWTPNVVMSLWFLLDPESALRNVDPRVADVLFILTITNSVVNPYVYGSYASEMRTKCLSWFGLGARRRGRGADVAELVRRNNSDQATGMVGGGLGRNTLGGFSVRYRPSYSVTGNSEGRSAHMLGASDVISEDGPSSRRSLGWGRRRSSARPLNNSSVEFATPNNFVGRSSGCLSSSGGGDMETAVDSRLVFRVRNWPLIKRVCSKASALGLLPGTCNFSSTSCQVDQPQPAEPSQKIKIPRRSRSMILSYRCCESGGYCSRITSNSPDDFSIFTASPPMVNHPISCRCRRSNFRGKKCSNGQISAILRRRKRLTLLKRSWTMSEIAFTL